MIEFILIFISISFIISVITHLSEGFKGHAELNMICSLCIICVVVIPISRAAPGIIEKVEGFSVDSDISVDDKNFEEIQYSISQNLETSVKELIENEYGIEADVNVFLNFEDMSSIKLTTLEVATYDCTKNSEIYKFLKSIYFCEVKIYEKQ